MPSYQVLGLPRNPLGVALKDVLSFGIWGKFWLVRINRELDGHQRFHLNFRWLWVLVLLPIITPIFVKWKTLHRLDKALRHQATIRTPDPKLLWLISLVPILGTVTWSAWTQSLLNRHWLWHKRDERIEAKANRIAELRPYAGEARTRTKIATLEAEVHELEAEREKELAAAASRRRVQEEKAAARAGKPRRSLIPVRLGRKKREEAPAVPVDEAPAEEAPARKLPLPFLRRKKSEPEPPPVPPTPEAAAAPPAGLTPKEQKKLEKQRAKEEAKRAKFEAKEAKQRAKEDARAAKEAKKRAKEGEPEPAPAAPAAPSTTTVTQTQASSGPQVTKTVKVLTLRCPQCQTRIPGIRKIAGEPTEVECPSCHFQATV